MSLRLTRAAYDAVVQHATEDYPAEAVGLLVGPARGPVAATHRLVNEERRYPRLGYRVGWESLEAAHHHLADAGRTVLGVYHSHCDRWALFSPVDRSGAAAGVVHLIVAVHGSSVEEVRAWVRTEDGPEREVAIEVFP